MSTTTIHIYKQNLKFSSAHFLIFDSKNAEKLHGHNYQVRLDMQVKNNPVSGYSINFEDVKSEVKKLVDQLDEQVLLPEQNEEMKFKVTGKNLEVTFRDRFYSFPKNEVVLLPMVNTSVELLSKYLAEIIFKKFSKQGAEKIRVLVEETRGQGASFSLP